MLDLPNVALGAPVERDRVAPAAATHEDLDVASTARTPVGRILADWRTTRGGELVRRFRHGAGATSLIRVDGQTAVLEAWVADAGPAAQLASAPARMQVMRGRGVPIPALLEQGAVDGIALAQVSAVRRARLGTAALLRGDGGSDWFADHITAIGDGLADFGH